MCFAATAKSIVKSIALRSQGAAPHLTAIEVCWTAVPGAIWSSVTTAAISATLTTPARIDILGMPAPEPPESLESAYHERYAQLTGCSLWQCPVCHPSRMLVIEILPRSTHRQVAIKNTS
jgi:hypothetical protein